MVEPTQPILLNTKASAREIGTTPGVLKQSRQTGYLQGVPAPRFVKIGKKSVRYIRTDLVDWVQKLKTYKKTADCP